LAGRCVRTFWERMIWLAGVPLGSAAGERSFGELLISSGSRAIHFSPNTTKPQFARFARLPRGNAKPASLRTIENPRLACESESLSQLNPLASRKILGGGGIRWAQLTQKVLLGAPETSSGFLRRPTRMRNDLARRALRSARRWRRCRWPGGARLGRWRGRDSDLAAAGVQAGELEALVGFRERWGPSVAPACGILLLARQSAWHELRGWCRVGNGSGPAPVGVEGGGVWRGWSLEWGVELVAWWLEV